MLRRGSILVVAVLAALVAVPIASGDSTTDLEVCGSGPPPGVAPPCVVSVKRNGVVIPYNQVLDTGEDVVFAITYHITGDPTKYFNFAIRDEHDQFSLDPSAEYELVLNLGSVFPGETFARGHDVVIDRSADIDGDNIVSFTQHPVRMADQGCNGAGVCAMTAGRTSSGYLEGWVNDLAYRTDPDDRAAMRGFDLASNADYVSSPLELDYVTNSIFLRVANSHFEGPPSPAGTPFVGFAEFKLPFPMLTRLYEVDDPASLTPSAFSVTGAGGAATTVVDVDATGHAVHVQLEGLTFSRRRLQIHGDTRPGKVKDLQAKRQASTRGRIRFLPATARGSKIRGYKAMCRHSGRSLRYTAWVIGPGSPLILRNLSAGTPYKCKVRALSRAGRGRSARVTMPRLAG